MIDDNALSNLLAQAEWAEKHAVEVMAEEADPLMEFLDERVKANAPLKTGNLINHITVDAQPTDTGIEYTFTAGTDYALQVHKRPPVEGRQDPDGSEPEGGRGRKYFTRVMDAHAEEILDVQKRAYERLGGKQ